MDKDQNFELDDDLSAEDLAAIEEMKKATPDQTGDAPGGDRARAEPEPVVAEEPATPEAKDGDDDDEDEDEEVVITGPDGKPRDAKGQFVPKSALLRVKEQRKAERETNRQLQERLARGEERLNLLTEILNASPEPEDTAKPAVVPNPLEEEDIDPQTDPIGAVKQANARTKYALQLVTETRKAVTDGSQQQKAHSTEMAIVDAYKRDSVAFYQKNPDFKDAWVHVLSQRHAQLEAVGIVDKGERDRIIAEEERGIVHKAYSQKKSPAEAIYKFAVASGYKKAAAPAVTTGADGKPVQSEAAKKITEKNAQMAATKSLSGAGGNAVAENSALLRLADMSDDEFCDFADTKEGRAALKKLGMIE